MKCRHCRHPLNLSLIDLGTAPPSNAYLKAEQLHSPELWFPLKVMVCDQCWLVQTQDFTSADSLFDQEYAYFSSFSQTWLDHAAQYVMDMVDYCSLDNQSYVVEVAANDGYLLQYVLDKQIPCLGIEPTASTAAAAKAKGIPIIEEFFGVELAEKLCRDGKQADLTIANNVLAHVPEINDFVSGFRILLKPNGVATFEFPHLLNLIRYRQFDTIYHEHFSYLSLTSVVNIFKTNGLTVFDVAELPTHGGSLRVFAQRQDTGKREISPKVELLLRQEQESGLLTTEYYEGFQKLAEQIKYHLLHFLLMTKAENKVVVGYGAAAKGNTLLNFAGIRGDLLRFVADRNPAKQGKFLPGSQIPIVAPEEINKLRPDYVLILPWNWRDEIIDQLSFIREWGGQFVTAVPGLEVV